MKLSRRIADTMTDIAIDASPREMCGLLVGRGPDVTGFMPMTNVATEHDRFQMDANEQVDARIALQKKGLHMIGIVHSHINVSAEPSARDIVDCAYATTYLIVGLSNSAPPSIRAFKMFPGLTYYEEEEVTVT
jgi:proteasome lid subunit RPN8/RPN11